MNMSRLGSWLCTLSIFGIVILWGYTPTLWLRVWPQQVLFGVALLGALLWLIFSLEQLKFWLKKRSTRYGISLVITAVATLFIMGFLNFWAVKFNKKWDLTQNKMHTLSEQTINVVGHLEQPVTITVWTSSVERMSPNIVMRKFLESYRIAGNGKVTVQIRNHNEESLAAKQAGITRDNTIVVTAASGRESRIDSFNDSRSEELLTNAIIKAIKDGKKKMLCFLTGHGELPLNESGPTGLSVIKERLVDAAYDAKEITIADKGVPSDCEGLVVVGPQGAPLGDEIKVLKEYFEKGGKLLALVGPPASVEWRNMAADYGVKIREDLIVDLLRNPPVVVVTKNFSQDIDFVKGFETLTFLPQVSSIQIPTASEVNGVEVQAFMSSEEHTYAKEGSLRSIRSLQRLSNDRVGPLTIGAVITKKLPVQTTPPESTEKKESPEKEEEKKAPFVLIANNTFVANSFVTKGGNMDLFLNAVNFVLQDKDLMGIRPREIRKARLELNENNVRQVMATVLLVALAFAIGGVSAARRRSRLV